MRSNASIALVVTLLPALLLHLWTLTYLFSDWAVVWLLALAAMIFCSNWAMVTAHWKAERSIVLRSDSWLARLITGRIRAFLSSTLLVLALVPALAWHALAMSAVEALVLLVLAFSSAWLFLAVRSFLARHVLSPFDRLLATRPSAWLIGLPFSVIMFLAAWYTTIVPAEMFSASFSEVVRAGFRKIPERRGWIAEFLAIGYAVEDARLWIMAQLREYRSVALFLNLDAALLGLLAARASVVITHFVERNYGGEGE